MLDALEKCQHRRAYSVAQWFSKSRGFCGTHSPTGMLDNAWEFFGFHNCEEEAGVKGVRACC